MTLFSLEALMERAREHSPGRRLATVEELGALAAHFCSDQARSPIGETVHVDAGYHVMD